MPEPQTSFFLSRPTDNTAGSKCRSSPTSASSSCVPLWLAPPAAGQVLSPLCTSAQGLVLRVLGGGCFPLWVGVQPFFATYQSLALVQTYLFEITLFIHISKSSPKVHVFSRCRMGLAKLKLSHPFYRRGCQGSETEAELIEAS